MSKNGMKDLVKLTAYLQACDPDMNMSKLQIFLLVGLGRDVLVRDLVKQTGMNQSTIARNLGILSDKPMRGKKEGLGWVVQRPDPEDSRRMFINITPKGKKVLAEIAQFLS